MSVPDKLVSRARDILKRSGKLFLDYDGTLVPIMPNPEDCVPDDELIQLLDRLKSRWDLFIVTGRSLGDIREFLNARYSIIALHGAVIMEGENVTDNIPELNLYRNICDRIYNNKELFEKQFEGLRLYNKDGNLLFHLGYISDDGTRDKVVNAVERMGSENQMDVYKGKNIVELRPPGINKGIAIRKIRNGSKAIIAGDDLTDEDSFIENPDALRIKVGEGETAADYLLEDYVEMRAFLSKL